MADQLEKTPSGWLRRLLFVDSSAATPLPAPRPHDRFVMTVLLRRRRGTSSRQFRRQVEIDLADRLRRRRDDLALASLKVYRDVSAGGILSLFVQLTRSRGYTAFLCRVLRRSPPPPCRVRYGVLHDLLLRITFERPPEPSQLEGVLELLRSPDISASECTVLASAKQYTVYDSRPGGDERRRVNICFLVRHLEGSTRDACQQYWRVRHADLALRNMQHIGLTRYLQVHVTESAGSGSSDVYDGVVFAEKSSLGRFLIDFVRPNSFRVNNTLIVDETNFMKCPPVMLLRLSSSW